MGSLSHHSSYFHVASFYIPYSLHFLKRRVISHWWNGKSNCDDRLSPLPHVPSLFTGISLVYLLLYSMGLGLEGKAYGWTVVSASLHFSTSKTMCPVLININKANIFWFPSLWFPCLYHSWFWMQMKKEVFVNCLRNPNIPLWHFQSVPSHWLHLLQLLQCE